MLTNHDSNRNRNMSRTDEGKESETNEDKQKNEVRDAFTTKQFRAVKLIFISRVAELIFFNSLCILCGISAF